jgi:hypothetical protein
MRESSAARSNVQYLNIDEQPVVEKTAIVGLQSALGLESSRDVVERAAFEVSDRLSRLEFALMNGDLEKTSKIASGLGAISQQIGLCQFAAIADDLVGAIHDKDFVAIAAISNRLLRQGERALYDAINLQDEPKPS